MNGCKRYTMRFSAECTNLVYGFISRKAQRSKARSLELVHSSTDACYSLAIHDNPSYTLSHTPVL
jgi:hypothetical protein